MLKKMIEAIRKSGNAALIAKLEAFGPPRRKTRCWPVSGSPGEAHGRQRPRRRRHRHGSPGGGGPGQPAAPQCRRPAAAPVQEAVVNVTGSGAGKRRPTGGRLFLENTLNGCSLPDPVKAQLRKPVRSRDPGGEDPGGPAGEGRDHQRDRNRWTCSASWRKPASSSRRSGRPRVEVLARPARQGGEALDAFFGVKTTKGTGRRARNGPPRWSEGSRRMRSFRGCMWNHRGQPGHRPGVGSHPADGIPGQHQLRPDPGRQHHPAHAGRIRPGQPGPVARDHRGRGAGERTSGPSAV
jgi:hypothetical protein